MGGAACQKFPQKRRDRGAIVPLSLDSARSLFRAGHFVELVEQAKVLSAAQANLPELHLLIAHALFHTADTLAAEKIVCAENTTSASPSIRAHCEQILGLLRRRQGAVAAARIHFYAAAQLAKESRDYKRGAWAALQL